MASLVLGGIGAYAFGPIGFLAGSLLGNLLFPQKIDNGPQSNLKLQGSEYGKMIPIGFGTGRVAGQVIWQTDLTPHRHTSGGKGGPQVTTYTYTASFAIKIAKGPAAGILRIRRNSEIIYDTTSTSTVDSGSVPVTIYLGYESALPDPTMESILGVGNVPAFRDDVVAVFTDYDLGEGGNTLGNFDFDVFFSGGPIPWRVSSFTALANQGSLGNLWTAGYDPLTSILTVANYNDTLNLNYNEQQFLQDGTTTGTPIVSQALDAPPSGGVPRTQAGAAVTGLNAIYAFDGTHDPGTREGSWYIGSSKVGVPIASLGGPWGDCSTAVDGRSVYNDGYIYAVWHNGSGGTNGVARWIAPAGIPTGISDASITITPANGSAAASNIFLGTSDTGDVFIAIDDAAGSVPPELYWYNADFSTLKHHWIAAVHGGAAPYIPVAAPDGIRGLNGNFLVYQGMICVNSTEPGPIHVATVWRINADFSFSKDAAVAPIINGALTQGRTNLFRFNNGLVLGSDGVISLDPEQLSVTRASIVSAISGLVTLSSSDIDVSDLTDLVDGFLITSRGPAKSSLDELRVLNPPFDAVERSGQAVFVTRGGQPILTIPDDELAARDGNDGDPGELAEIDRLDESTLPASVNVTFINSGAAYQSGSQQAIRQTALTTQGSDVNLAVAMSDTRAKQIANIVLYETWWERMPLRFSTSRKYARLEPSDVVSLRDYTVRIEKKRHAVGGVIEFEAKRSNPALYLAAPTTNPTSGGGQPSTGTAQPTNLVLLNLPLVADADDGTSFYAAMAGSIDAAWRGGNLYRSSDNGATWSALGGLRTPSVIGRTSDALPDFGGGNVFDEGSEVTVVVGPGGGELINVDRAAIFSGANKLLIGKEIVQPRNAELIAPDTYKLSGFLRGRRGTEWAMPNHQAGEQVVLLDNVLRVTDPVTFRGQSLLYKAVTLGQTLASANQVSFIDLATTLQPLSPVHVGGGINSSDDILVHWTRRTRLGGEWVNYADVPLSEPAESYVLQVWDAAFKVCARVVTGLTSPAFTYTAAMQVVDFGATQQTIYVSVAQVGSYLLGVQAFASIPGAGSTVDAPLHPQTPYNVAPPSSAPVTICPGSVTTDVLTWAAGVTQLFSPSDLGPGKYWVIKFTVPGGAIQGGGNALGVEYASPIASRKAVLSRTPCGLPLIPTAAFDGATDVQFYFYVGANPHPQTQATLVPGETYYISITNTEIVSQMLVNFYTKG